MKRSTFLAGSSLLATAPLWRNTALAMTAAPTYILVHGAFEDASCWVKVLPQLRAAGAHASALDLPGHNPQDGHQPGTVTFDNYVDAVSAAVDAAGAPVILVGHSMGGMIVSQVAEKRPRALKSVVYLSAYLPGNGDSLLALSQTDADSRLVKYLTVDQAHGIATVSDDGMRDAFFNGCSPADVELGLAHKRTQPLQPFIATVTLTDANYGSVPRFYLTTLQDRAVSTSLQARLMQQHPCKKTYNIDAGHASFFSAPDAVSSALLDVAKQ